MIKAKKSSRTDDIKVRVSDGSFEDRITELAAIQRVLAMKAKEAGIKEDRIRSYFRAAEGYALGNIPKS